MDRKQDLAVMKYFKLLVFVLFCSQVQASEPFPKADELFKPLIADPKEVRTEFEYMQIHSMDTIDISLGRGLGLKRWNFENVSIQGDVSGVIRSRFIFSTSVNKLEDVDYTINLPLEIKRKQFSYRLSLSHESSHGSEGLGAVNRTPITYSQEAVQVLAAFDCADPGRPEGYRIYLGGSQLLHSLPNVDGTSGHIGFEILSPKFELPWNEQRHIRLFFAHDVQARSEVGYDLDRDTQMGFYYGTNKDDMKLKFFGNLFTGHSRFGQFFRDEEARMSLGVGFIF